MAYPEAWHDKVGSGSDNDTHGPTSLMINDILALQYLYGANNEWARGDDLYHFGGRASADDVLHETIWDTGGVDEFSWQGQSNSARINLNQGSLSFFGAITALDSPLLTSGDFGEGTGIVGIAFKTIIENATGGDGDDHLISNEVANQLDGGAGADRLYGGDGDDTLFGYGGVNILNGGAGDDNIFADSGRAIMTGGAGYDVFAISHIASTIANACVITDFHFALIELDSNLRPPNTDWLDLTPIIDALWIDQTRSVDTGQDSNDSALFDTVLYADELGEEVVVILEDFTYDIAEIMSDSTIELNDFNPVII